MNNKVRKPAKNHPWKQQFGTTVQRKAVEQKAYSVIPAHARPIR